MILLYYHVSEQSPAQAAIYIWRLRVSTQSTTLIRSQILVNDTRAIKAHSTEDKMGCFQQHLITLKK